MVEIFLNPYLAARVGPYTLENPEFTEIGVELGIVLLLLFVGFSLELKRAQRTQTSCNYSALATTRTLN